MKVLVAYVIVMKKVGEQAIYLAVREQQGSERSIDLHRGCRPCVVLISYRSHLKTKKNFPNFWYLSGYHNFGHTILNAFSMEVSNHRVRWSDRNVSQERRLTTLGPSFVAFLKATIFSRDGSNFSHPRVSNNSIAWLWSQTCKHESLLTVLAYSRASKALIRAPLIGRPRRSRMHFFSMLTLAHEDKSRISSWAKIGCINGTYHFHHPGVLYHDKAYHIELALGLHWELDRVPTCVSLCKCWSYSV